MLEARERRGLSQERLGSMVGTSQNMISLIESGGVGGVGGSQFVLPISQKLGIAPPFYGTDEQQTWLAIGISLSSRNPEMFKQARALIEVMLQHRPETDTEADVDDSPRSAVEVRTRLPR